MSQEHAIQRHFTIRAMPLNPTARSRCCPDQILLPLWLLFSHGIVSALGTPVSFVDVVVIQMVLVAVGAVEFAAAILVSRGALAICWAQDIATTKRQLAELADALACRRHGRMHGSFLLRLNSSKADALELLTREEMFCSFLVARLQLCPTHDEVEERFGGPHCLSMSRLLLRHVIEIRKEFRVRAEEAVRAQRLTVWAWRQAVSSNVRSRSRDRHASGAPAA
eukprot:Polyplicarium_translucidae@DN2824_c0_g1_i4.p1